VGGGGSSGSSGGRQAGYLAWTSVGSAVPELARSAAKQLPGGIRLCVEGHEEGRLTHLLMGAERRTLKLLLGVANGAWLLQPEWLTASIEKVGGMLRWGVVCPGGGGGGTGWLGMLPALLNNVGAL
jgi:hypothetical protein